MLYKLFGPGRSSAISSRGLDLDRDGVADLVVGAPGAKAPGWNVGSVFAFSLRDGTELHRVNSDFRTVGSSSMGQMVTTLRSPPGSPFAQFAFSQPRFGSDEILGSLGRIAVYQGSPAGVKVFGTTCRGTLKTAPKIGIRDLGKKGIRLQLSGGAPASPAALLLGLSRTRWGNFSLPLALDPFGFTGCKLYTSIELLLLTSTGNTGISKGYGLLDLPIQLSATGKLTLHGQWLSLGAGKLAPGALSDAILLRLR